MHDLTCTGTAVHVTCTAAAHDIHWGVIFGNAPLWIMFLVLSAVVVLAYRDHARKQKAEVTRLGHGDQVSVTMANGEVRTGYVAGSSPTAINGGFTILCRRDPS